LGRDFGDGALEDAPPATDNTIRLIDMEMGQQIRTFTGHRDTVNSLSFSPDGRYLLSGSFDAYSGSPETSMILWDVETGEAIRYYKWEEGIILNAIFTPDARHFVSLAGHDFATLIHDSITLWDVETGERVLTMGQDYGELKSIDISTGGRYVALLLNEPVGDPPQSRVLVLDSMNGETIREFTADGPPNTAVITFITISAGKIPCF
jgi:WD40 repeat protein